MWNKKKRYVHKYMYCYNAWLPFGARQVIQMVLPLYFHFHFKFTDTVRVKIDRFAIISVFISLKYLIGTD